LRNRQQIRQLQKKWHILRFFSRLMTWKFVLSTFSPPETLHAIRPAACLGRGPGHALFFETTRDHAVEAGRQFMAPPTPKADHPWRQDYRKMRPCSKPAIPMTPTITMASPSAPPYRGSETSITR
jgi:hypothetical protein